MDYKELQDKYSKLSVLVCGDMCLDKNYIGKYSGYSRELESLPVFRADIENCGAGGAGNLAICFSTLGIKTYAIGVWGNTDDFNRHILENEFQNKNVDTFRMVVGTRTPTFGKVYFDNGSHIFRLDLVSQEITDEVVNKLINKLYNITPSVDFIVCADYEESNNFGVCSEKVLNTIKKMQLPKFCTSRKRINRFNNFNYVLLNKKEFEEQFYSDYNSFDQVIVTNGGKGAKVYLDNTIINCNSIELTKDIDPCGCGDMFYASYASSIMAGYDVETSLRIANSSARVVAKKRFGTGQSTVNELIEEYKEIYGDNK